MKIDRALVLVVAGTLAGACQVYVGPPKPAVTAAAPTANQSPPAPAAATTAKPAQTAAPKVKVLPVHLGHFAGGGAAGAAPAPSGGGSASSPTPVPPAPACLDTAAAANVPSCSSLPAADSSCSTNTVPQQKCAAYAAYYDPKIAAAAISCLSSTSAKQLCDANESINCGHSALSQACPDSTLAQLCNVAATSCKSSAEQCTALLSGLNDQGKQQVAQCIAQGCGSGLEACVDGLTAATPTTTKAVR